MLAAILTFALTALLLIAAASLLTHAADAISLRTGIGRVWIGSVLLAGATSLPELATDVSAVRMGAPDLAAGDLFGSSMANMLILGIVDLLPPRRRVLLGAALENALGACLAILLNALAALLVLMRPQGDMAGISPGSFLLFATYLAGSRAVYRSGKRAAERDPARSTSSATAPSLAQASARFAGAALVILVCAPLFAAAAKTLAELSGLGTTFVGTFLVGLCTSLPELVAAVAAVRMGAFDLAVGNLFGSNAFNMVVFLAMDLADPGAIFAALDPSHALSAFLAVLLMALGLAAIVYRVERRFALIEPDSVLVVLVYLGGIWLLHAHAVP
jgi:cation:H+ antiporter